MAVPSGQRAAEYGRTDARPAHRRFARLVSDVRACEACPDGPAGGGMAHCHVLGAANGPLSARVVFVAEAVGRRGGAVTGVPLTRDAAGERFEAFLALAGIGRGAVFITNAVLCNPLDAHGRNRPPSPHERARCVPFLARTLDVVRAPYVVTLGRVALDAVRAIETHDAELRRDVATALAWRGRTLIPMYHPGRRSTLHRSQLQQERDWGRLGELLAPR